MKCFFVFAPMFYELPMAIVRELEKEVPEASFCGLSTGSRQVFDAVNSSTDPVVKPLVWLDSLERQWLRTPADDSRLEYYEKMLGADDIKRVIIADRQIGSGYVKGVYRSKSPLSKLTMEHDNLRNYIVGLLDCIFDLLETEKPDMVFCYTVAGAPACALSLASHHLKIPFLRISSARIKSRYVIDNSTDVQLNQSHTLFERALDDPDLVKAHLDEAREYIGRFREKPVKYDASRKIHTRHVKQLSLVNIVLQLLKDIRMTIFTAIKRPPGELRKPSALQITVDRLSVNMNARKISKSGIFTRTPENLQRPYIFFPLHVNPEASTMVQSPMHTNQYAIIESISKSAPLSMDIIVKEHIPMLGKRPLEFYEELLELPGVRFASPFEDSFEFIKRAELVCSITSTVAWESILLKRPALIIGNPYFTGLGAGFAYCSDIASLPSALNKAMSIRPVDDRKLELYIASILATSFDMPIDIYTGGVTRKMVENHHDTVKSITDRILENLESLPVNQHIIESVN